jgi:hypothetical protein
MAKSTKVKEEDDRSILNQQILIIRLRDGSKKGSLRGMEEMLERS